MPQLRPSDLLTALGLALAAACGDSAGPGNPGALEFTATLDGVVWTADTATAIAFASPTDTTLSIAGVRRVSANEAHEVTLVLRSLGPVGHYPLGDSTSHAIAAFGVSQISGGMVTSSIVYWSGMQVPGSLSITTLSRTDSTVSGSFTFEAATKPDTAQHRRLSGHFRIRYSLVQVYPLGEPDAVPRGVTAHPK